MFQPKMARKFDQQHSSIYKQMLNIYLSIRESDFAPLNVFYLVAHMNLSKNTPNKFVDAHFDRFFQKVEKSVKLYSPYFEQNNTRIIELLKRVIVIDN